MRFMHIGAQALLAFTTILSGVASAPVGDDVLIADGGYPKHQDKLRKSALAHEKI